MTMLVTPFDIENFVKEMSPHVKSVEIIDDDDENNTTIIKIKITFWYRFFYEKIFYQFITNLIKEHQMYGVTYDVVIIS